MLHDEQLFDETVMDQEPSPLKYFGFSVCLCLFVHLNEPKPTQVRHASSSLEIKQFRACYGFLVLIQLIVLVVIKPRRPKTNNFY